MPARQVLARWLVWRMRRARELHGGGEIHPQEPLRRRKRVVDVFRAIDADESGTLDYRELSKGLAQILGFPLPSAIKKQLFAELDKDGGGDRRPLADPSSGPRGKGKGMKSQKRHAKDDAWFAKQRESKRARQNKRSGSW